MTRVQKRTWPSSCLWSVEGGQHPTKFQATQIPTIQHSAGARVCSVHGGVQRKKILSDTVTSISAVPGPARYFSYLRSLYPDVRVLLCLIPTLPLPLRQAGRSLGFRESWIPSGLGRNQDRQPQTARPGCSKHRSQMGVAQVFMEAPSTHSGSSAL